METLIAVAVAIGMLKAAAAPPAEPRRTGVEQASVQEFRFEQTGPARAPSGTRAASKASPILGY